MGFQELIHEIDSTNQEEFLKNNISILHFFSEWEMDCLMVLPIIESLAEEFGKKISFGRANIEDAKNLAKKHGVLRVPSCLFFKEGCLVDRIDKMNSEEALRSKISCLL